MTVRLSAQIMAHPSRAEMVDDLLARLDRPVGVTWDEVNDRHDTGIRAIEAYDPTATHHLVLQDDVLPCPDLLAGTERALGHVPDGHPASLYIGRVKPFSRAVQAAVDASVGASWITMEGIYWGPAIVVPTAVIPDLARWFRRHWEVTNYDKRLSAWFERSGLECWYAWPSLVEHRGDQSIAHPTANSNRRAHRWAADQSPLGIDWSGDVVHLASTARMDVIRQRRAVGVT